VSAEKAGEMASGVRAPHPVARNNAVWQQPGANNLPSEIGIGLDE
jgi:hypothetical protein